MRTALWITSVLSAIGMIGLVGIATLLTLERVAAHRCVSECGE